MALRIRGPFVPFALFALLSPTVSLSPPFVCGGGPDLCEQAEAELFPFLPAVSSGALTATAPGQPHLSWACPLTPEQRLLSSAPGPI